MRVSGPRGAPVIGCLPQVLRDRLNFMAKSAEAYGEVYRFTIGPQVLYVANDPLAIKHVLLDNADNYHKGIGLEQARFLFGDGLVTAEGATWKRRRRRIQPGVQRQDIASWAPIIVKNTNGLLDRWRTAGGHTANLHADLMALSLKNLGECYFGVDLAAQSAGVGAALDCLIDGVARRMILPLNLPLWVPTCHHRAMRLALSTVEDVVSEIIVDRRAQGAARGDVLDIILAAAGDSEYQQHDEVLTFLISGHETVAVTVTWALHLLARHPAAAGELTGAVHEALGSQDADAARVARIPLLTAVLHEAMRLYPAIWLIPRRAVGPDRIGDIPIPRGAGVIVCPYALHRNRRYWNHPAEFWPRRFLPGQPRAMPFTYLPFGAGPRSCIGNGFAMTEMQLILATIVQRAFVKCEPACVNADALLTLRPGHKIAATSVFHRPVLVDPLPTAQLGGAKPSRKATA
jgi:enediyne biosynthesis protein E7